VEAFKKPPTGGYMRCLCKRGLRAWQRSASEEQTSTPTSPSTLYVLFATDRETERDGGERKANHPRVSVRKLGSEVVKEVCGREWA